MKAFLQFIIKSDKIFKTMYNYINYEKVIDTMLYPWYYVKKHKGVYKYESSIPDSRKYVYAIQAYYLVVVKWLSTAIRNRSYLSVHKCLECNCIRL